MQLRRLAPVRSRGPCGHACSRPGRLRRGVTTAGGRAVHPAAGSETSKTAPPSGPSRPVTVPACASTTSRTSASPRPNPDRSRPSAAGAWANRFEQQADDRQVDAGTVVGHPQHDPPISGGHRHLDRPVARRVPRGIVDQGVHDPSQRPDGAEDDRRLARKRPAECDAALGGMGLGRLDGGRGDRSDVDLLTAVRLRLQRRREQQVRHDVAHPPRVRHEGLGLRVRAVSVAVEGRAPAAEPGW